MPTDTERREVAADLRYLADYPGVPVRYAEQFRDELSAVVLPDGFTHDYSELLQRLADLIEPQTSEQTNPRESSLSASLCDRDALLALADELKKRAGRIIRAARDARFSGYGPSMEEAKHDANEWNWIASCILEALGVEVR